MDWLSGETVTVDQTTWVRLVGWIVFDDFTVQYAEENFVKGQTVCLCFFVGVVSDAYSIMTNSVNNVLDVQSNFVPCCVLMHTGLEPIFSRQ